MSQRCPLCGKDVEYTPRYPRYICNSCQEAHPPVNAAGHPVTFHNLSFAGGFGSTDTVTGEVGEDHFCWINGVKCYADEARFGGIVIQLHTDDSEE